MLLFISVSPRTSSSMCIKSTKLSTPGETTVASTASNPTMVVEQQRGGSRIEDGGSQNREGKVPYQNVTLAGSPLCAASSGGSLGNLVTSSSSHVRGGGVASKSLFQMEDKKAESQSKKQEQHQQLLKAVEAAEATSMTSSTASLVLSGGCVINLMASDSNQQVINVVHHHHHHFNKVNGQMSTLTNSSVVPPPPMGSKPLPLLPCRTPGTALPAPTSSTSSTSISPPQIQSTSNLSSSVSGNGVDHGGNAALQLRNQNSNNRNFYVNLSNIHRCLNMNKYLLEHCGFYYGAMNWSQSTELLRRTSEGTFLVRDSSDSRFLYSLSVQRGPGEGPTSVRIHFAHGQFRLDADEQIEHLMPTFDSVLDLANYYCQLSQSDRAKSHLWIDNATGDLYSPICLKKPLRKDVPTLAHAARIAVHQSLKSQASLPELNLPNRITNYLDEYPHAL